VSDALGASTRGKYEGPGWAEWLLGFGCTALAATQIRALATKPMAQTALSYYMQGEGIRTLHLISVVIDAIIVVCVASWIFAWRKAGVWATIIALACVAGASLCWFELIRAMTPDPTRVYRLDSLPYHPINNQGLLGSAIFLGYLMMKIPLPGMSKPAVVGLRLLLWIGIFGGQLILFDLWQGR